MTVVLETGVRAASICLAGLFVLAASHKATVLAEGRAAAEPVVRLAPWTYRHAAHVLAVAALAELTTACVLLASPAAGYVAAACLALVYGVAARGLPPDEPCKCFGRAFEARGAAGVVRRNIVIAVASAGAAGMYLTAVLAVRPLAAATVVPALALMVVAGARGLPQTGNHGHGHRPIPTKAR